MTTEQLPEQIDAVVVGGGFFGCQIALMLRESGARVWLVERETELLTRASYANQARVHNGYHYPRSVLTALRSRVNYPQFLRDFADCVDTSFAKYYAVARHGSKVNAAQFAAFCQRIGAPLRPAPPEVVAQFNQEWIEAVWTVEEVAFDAVRLAGRMHQALAEAGVHVSLGWSLDEGRSRADGRLELHATEVASGRSHTCTSSWLFNCTYSGINTVLATLGCKPVPLKHELAELCLIRPPEELRHAGVTVMCGAYFSTMPFPARGLHTLSHVRYTPHCAWEERSGPRFDLGRPVTPDDLDKRTYFTYMQRDAARYLPALARSEYVESLWAIKTVLPQSEGDDSRPILFRRHAELPQVVSVMGGKIDNIYDLPREIAALPLNGEPPRSEP